MAEHPASLFTFEAIARVLAEVDVFLELPSWDHARRLGIDVEHLQFAYTARMFASRQAADHAFWQRWTTAHASDLPHDPRSWEERFLRQEFALFCQPTDPRTQQREQILCQLRQAQTAAAGPPALHDRIHELCFWPGVLFVWVRAHVLFAEHVRAYTRQWRTWCKMHLDAGDKLKDGPFRNDPSFTVPYEKLDALQHVLQDADAAFATMKAWSRQLGLDKNLSLQPSKQGIWTHLFKELVDLLRPLCPGYTYFVLQKPITTPDQVYTVASQLMHLSHPTLWEHEPARIKSRLRYVPINPQR